MTITVATIAYFLKRYIRESDERNKQMHAENKESHSQMTQSYNALSETITELRLMMKKLQIEGSSSNTFWAEKFNTVEEKFQRQGKSIGELWAIINSYHREYNQDLSRIFDELNRSHANRKK
jgi:citrate synthase